MNIPQIIDPSVEPGNPNNWPRKLARNHPRLEDAIRDLEGQKDEHNESFALREFISERVQMAENQFKK